MEIYVVKYDGTGLTRLMQQLWGDYGGPQWSPDGLKIVFVSMRADINSDIYMMNADGSNQTKADIFWSSRKQRPQPALAPLTGRRLALCGAETRPGTASRLAITKSTL